MRFALSSRAVRRLVVLTLTGLSPGAFATPAGAHRVYPFGGQFPHTAGSWLYLPYTTTGYSSAVNGAATAWYNTPTKLWPYATTNYNVSRLDHYTQYRSETLWGLAVNKPCSYSGCKYNWTDIILNTRTMNPETAFTRQGIVVHEMGHGVGLSHVCGEASCPPGWYPTIMQWGRLAYNVPQSHDDSDVNGIYR